MRVRLPLSFHQCSFVPSLTIIIAYRYQITKGGNAGEGILILMPSILRKHSFLSVFLNLLVSMHSKQAPLLSPLPLFPVLGILFLSVYVWLFVASFIFLFRCLIITSDFSSHSTLNSSHSPHCFPSCLFSSHQVSLSVSKKKLF